MANYDVICPLRYPQKCSLLPVERKALKGPGKYTAFFMYQFKDNDPYLKKSVRKCFKSLAVHLLDPKESPGTGAKLCNICRRILAADFGVASLTPLNLNVFMEVGMFLGVGKPVLHLVNTRRCESKNLPFNLSGEMVVEHTSSEELNDGLSIQVPLFLEKVMLHRESQGDHREFQRKFTETVNERLNKLEEKEKEMLERFLLENREVEKTVLEKLLGVKVESNEFRNLLNKGFITIRTEQRVDIGNWSTVFWYDINPNYRRILEKFLFRLRE